MLPVYCDHFGLKKEPFSITPDPGFLYLSESHKEALAQLVYGIRGRRGFVVLTGEVGTGKTTLIHCLLNELNADTKTAMVFNLIVGAKDLLRYVCERFGILGSQDGQKELHDYLSMLEQFLLEVYRGGQNAALIIDEAQNLSTQVLESVRLLSNFETASHKLLQIFLVGQPELGFRLNAPELRQLKQRVALRHHLRPLNIDECKDYIRRRLEVANGTVELFTTEAIEAIHEYAGGIPRLVNILCDNGLLTAYALRKPAVERYMIAEIARDLQLALSPRTKPKSMELSYQTAGAAEGDLSAVPGVPDTGKPDRKLVNILNGREIRSGGPVGDRANGRRPTSNLVVSHRETDADPSGGKATLPARYIAYMTALLTDCMGPIASLVVQEQIIGLGERIEAFPKLRLGELVERVTSEILSESDKAACKRLMLEGLGQYEVASN